MNNQRCFRVVCVRFVEGKKKAIWADTYCSAPALLNNSFRLAGYAI
jgi:hypothetical protein